MKYFNELRVQLRALGVFNRGSGLKARIITIATRCSMLTMYVSCFISSTCYLLFEAQTLRQHSEIAFDALAVLFSLTWYLAVCCQSEKYMAIFDQLDSIIQKSKHNWLKSQGHLTI